MTPLFWIAVALDATLFVVLLVLGLTTKGPSDGGREMALFFYVLVPAVIVGGGVLLFLKSESTVWRLLALIIVAGPGLLLAGTRVRSAAIDYQIRKDAEGSGYFSGRDAKAAGVAVVRRDTTALKAVGKRIDVSTKGTRGMTLMELAVTGAFESPAPANGGATSLDVVRELLALHADPNAGLGIATKLPDSAILTALLDGGAKPSYVDDRGSVVFEWLRMMPLANFTALVDHGLDLNLTTSYGSPLIVEAAQADRWDIVQLLMARGADVSRGDAQGMRLADVVQGRMESTMERSPEMKADIARVKANLAATPSPQPTR